MLVVLPLMTGCLMENDNEVVVYSALDKEFSQPILEQAGIELGLAIRTKFDQESNKTVGLVTDLIQHQKRPRADLFWNNEILHTLRLQRLGLLEVWVPPAAENIPVAFRSPEGFWTGFAGRARVLIVNTDLIPDPQERPTSIYDLTDPKWKHHCAIARPLFGTSATHAAVLFDTLGAEQAKALYRQIVENAIVEGGNRQVAIKVGRGECKFGLTDTDDVMLEIDRGSPVVIVYPDQAADQMGALLIPNTLSLIRGGPNPTAARRVLERLLQPDVEAKLATGAGAQFPLNPDVAVSSRAMPPARLKVAEADFESAAEHWDATVRLLLAIFPPGR